MSFSVDYSNADSKDQAYDLVKARITPEYIEKWKVKAELKYNPKDKIVAEGKGFTLTMSFSDSRCDVDIKLGMLLKPLKGVISSEIEKQISRTV